MPTPGLGNQSFMSFGKETTPGVAATFLPFRMEIITADAKPDINTIPDPSLYSGQSRRGFFEGAKIYRATVLLRPTYQGGILEILRGVSGTYTSPVVSGETVVFDHTFKEAANLLTYTIEFCVGNIPALSNGVFNVFRMTGARFSAITFRSTAGNSADAMIQCELTILASDMQANQTETKKRADLVTTLTIPAAPNNNTITRASGSWVTDGVQVGEKVVIVPVGTALYKDGYAIVTNVAATTLTLDRTGVAGGSYTSLQYYSGYPPLNPLLFHQAQFVDDGVCTAFSGIPGTMSVSGTTFTRSDGLDFSTGAGQVQLGWHVGGSKVQVGTKVQTINAGVNGSIVLSKASGQTTGTATLSVAQDIRMRSFEITLQNNLTEDRFYMGSPSIDDPLRSDFLDATFRLTEEFQDVNAFNAARAFGNPLNPRLVFRVPGTTIGTGAVNREFEIHMDSTQPGEWSTPVEGYGVLISTMTLNAFNNVADASAITFRVRNDDAVLT